MFWQYLQFRQSEGALFDPDGNGVQGFSKNGDGPKMHDNVNELLSIFPCSFSQEMSMNCAISLAGLCVVRASLAVRAHRPLRDPSFDGDKHNLD